MIDLARLQYFAAVAETGSFSRAALSLGLTQPAISRQVRLLEKEVGQALLERNGHGVILTEAGAAFLCPRGFGKSGSDLNIRYKFFFGGRMNHPGSRGSDLDRVLRRQTCIYYMLAKIGEAKFRQIVR